MPDLQPIAFYMMEGSDLHYLPVTPEILPQTEGRNHHTVEIINGRQLGHLGNVKLSEFRLEGLWPYTYDPAFCLGSSVERPQVWVDRVRRWMKEAVNLQCFATYTPIRGMFYVVGFTWEYRHGHPRDVWYSLDFKENTDVTSSFSTSGTMSGIDAPSSQRYTVVAGDTLWKLAKKFYGDGSKWSRIYNANQPLASGNPQQLTVGEVLIIP